MFTNFFKSLISQNQLPSTQVFWGSSYSGTSSGGIGIDAEKEDASKAKITFTDKDRHKKIAQLEVFHLDKLKNMSIYQSSVEENKPERLVNTWITRRNNNTIIKTANARQLAFAFTSPSEVENDLKKLFNLTMIDYFKEATFCSFLKNKLNLTIDQLRTIPGMDSTRINLLLEHHSSFENLIDFGFTIERLSIMNKDLLNLLMGNWGNSGHLKQLLDFGITPAQIAVIDYNHLKNVFSHRYYLENALNFVTIEQILGLDSKPLPLTKVKKSEQPLGKFLGSSSDGSFGDYVHTKNATTIKKTVKITHLKKEGVFEAISKTLNEDLLKDFDKIIENMTPIKLIHDWYIIKVNDKQRMLYCPELKDMTHETHQLEVPKEYLELEMIDSLFYKENKFANFLTEKGCPIDRFRTLPGMSEQKFKFLSENQYVMKELMAKGIKIEEFASIDDLRLENVVSNYNKLSNALKLVPLSLIVDLPSASIRSDSTPTESLGEREPIRMRLA